MKTIFLGHQHIGATCLEKIVSLGVDVCAAIGHEGKQSIQPIADKYGIPFQSVTSCPQSFADINPDWILSVYFRYLIPTSLLNAPYGAMNIHGSLLPDYRGCSPVNWALIHGEKRVGVTLHDMAERADAGSIIDQIAIDVSDHEQAGDVMERLAACAAQILERQLPHIKAQSVTRRPQGKLLKSYPKRTPADAVIDWSKSANEIHNLIRAVNPVELYGGARAFESTWLITQSWVEARGEPLIPGSVIGNKDCLAVVACGSEGKERLRISYKEIRDE